MKKAKQEQQTDKEEIKEMKKEIKDQQQTKEQAMKEALLEMSPTVRIPRPVNLIASGCFFQLLYFLFD